MLTTPTGSPSAITGKSCTRWRIIRPMARLRLSPEATVTTAWLMTSDTATEIAASPRREMAYTISRSDMMPLDGLVAFHHQCADAVRWRMFGCTLHRLGRADVKTSALLGPRL